MKKLFILLFSMVMAGEMEVDGDLKVVGNVQVGTIDSLEYEIVTLKLLIAQLQAQIALLETQMAFLGQDLNNGDCAGVVGGSAVIDDCGVCEGNNESVDICGVCGGDAISEDDCPAYAIRFDGYPQHVEVQNNNESLSIPGEMTIQAQVTVNEFGVMILARERDGGDQNRMNYDLGINTSGKFSFHIENSVNDNDFSVTASTIATIGETYLVVGIYDGDSLKIIVDSIVENTFDVEDGFTAYTGSGSLFIGRSKTNSEEESHYFKGILDEIRIWNRTLQLEEIISNQNSALTGNESGLAGYWNFNEGSGSTLNDLSANANHGTIMNMDESNWVER